MTWQKIVYEIDNVTPEIISFLQRLFKNKAEEQELTANVCHELANLSTLLKGPALKLLYISIDQLIDPNMSLDPALLFPIKETVGSDPTKTTHLSSQKSDTSLVLPSTENNIDSLMETEDF